MENEVISDRCEGSKGPETAEKMYELARWLGWKTVKKLDRGRTYLEHEDYVQEVMLVWVQSGKKRTGWACIDAFRRAAPLARSLYKHFEAPTFEQVEDWMLSGDGLEERLIEKDVRRKLWQAVNQIRNHKVRWVIQDYYFFGKTQGEIGDLMGLTESRISQLRKIGVELLKGFFNAKKISEEEYL